MNNMELKEMTMDELQVVDGGMAPAAIYALGFVMGTNPAAALAICAGVVVAGAVVAVACN